MVFNEGTRFVLILSLILRLYREKPQGTFDCIESHCHRSKMVSNMKRPRDKFRKINDGSLKRIIDALQASFLVKKRI